MSGNAMAGRHKPPHERKDGPWDEYELEDGARHLGHAERIRGNKKFLEAIRKHEESRAAEHHRMAHHAGMLAKSGHISPKAMQKLADKQVKSDADA